MDTPCDVVQQYNSNTSFHIIQGIQIFFSVIAVIIVVHTAIRYFVTSIFERVFKGMLIIVQLTSGDPCQAQLSKVVCYSFRIAATLPVSSVVWIQLGISASRERLQVIAGRAMIIVSVRESTDILRYCVAQIVYPSVIMYILYRDENFEGRVPYCAGCFEREFQASQFNVFFMLSIDMVNLVLEISVLKYNKYKLKFAKSFRMVATFRRRQNVYAIQEYLPSSIFHCVCYIAQALTVTYGRSFRQRVSEIDFVIINTYVHLMPYYCAIGPIIFLVLLRKGRLNRKERLKNVVVPVSDDTHDVRQYYAVCII
ncbi:hypothetical protein PENTCL1PPCAC_29139, partial [Pristionchus entomophagus]